jgi:DNA ligase-1
MEGLTMNSYDIYKVIQKLAATPSTKKKVKILRENNNIFFKKVLIYAYDPTILYHMKNPIVDIWGENDFTEEFFSLLGDINDRIYTGNRAIDEVKKYLATLSIQSQDLAISIINKDLRCGINTELINKAFPELIHSFKVMLAVPFNEKKLRFPCLLQPKIDGVRALYMNGKFYSRTGKIFKGLDHILVNCTASIGPLDGELIVPNMSFEDSTGLIKDHNSTPDAEYHIFDIKNTVLLHNHRHKILHDTIVENKHVKLVPTFTCNNRSQLNIAFQAFVKNGFEGLMIKKMNHKYMEKRSNSWMKMKAQKTIDLKVVDVVTGTGKYDDMLGALVCEYKGKTVRVGTGFSDKQREEFLLDPPVGKMIEIFYQNKTKNSRLRHPSFKCIKDGM